MPKDIKPDGQKVTVRVSDTLDRLYAVEKKAIESPDKHEGKDINWVAYFGFKLKKGVEKGNRKLDNHGFITGDLEEDYTISLPKEGDQLVCYDGEKINSLHFWTENAESGKTAHATLKAGDPAIGWT